MLKGTQQGSILCPFVFDVFQNDLMYVMRNTCDIYNYADDNTIGCQSENIKDKEFLVLKNTLDTRMK